MKALPSWRKSKVACRFSIVLQQPRSCMMWLRMQAKIRYHQPLKRNSSPKQKAVVQSNTPEGFGRNFKITLLKSQMKKMKVIAKQMMITVTMEIELGNSFSMKKQELIKSCYKHTRIHGRHDTGLMADCITVEPLARRIARKRVKRFSTMPRSQNRVTLTRGAWSYLPTRLLS